MAELNLTKQTFSSDFFIIRNGVTYCVESQLQVDFNKNTTKLNIKSFDFAVCLTDDFPERFAKFLADIVNAAIEKKREIGGGQLSLFDDQDIDSCSDADQFEFQFEENETLR